MATSAFKSTTQRTPIGAKSNPDDSASSSTKAHRRSRSLSRFSHPLPEDDVPAPRGKFVNTTRGSGFPEISLDDLAVEFFPLLKSDEEEKIQRSRPSRRTSEVSPANNAHQTTPFQRRGRSVSRHTARDSDGKSGIYNNNKYNTSNSSSNNDDGANLRRRRSVSVAWYQISDSEQSDKDQSQRSSNRAIVKSFSNGNTRMASLHKPVNGRRLTRSHSQKDLLRLHDGYSSHSSAVTDDEMKEAHNGNNGVEKTIRAVYAQKKAEHPVGEDVNGGLYQAMRKELRYAVKEIRTELEQAMVQRNSMLAGTDNLESGKVDVHHAVSAITKSYATKLEQSEKSKQDLLAEMLLEEQSGKELSKIVKELLPPESQSTTLAQSPLQARKRSNDKSRMSERLTEEAEKYFEDFISNIEDTDISSIDGERSDASSSLGVMHKQREIAANLVERTAGYLGKEGNSRPAEMDGVILPWLQWETSNDVSPLPSKMQAQLPITPKAKMWDAAQDLTSIQDSSDRSSSSHWSWSPGVDVGSVVYKEVGRSNYREVGSLQRSRFDMDEYVQLQRNEELLFERWRERERISSGGLLLCTNHF